MRCAFLFGLLLIHPQLALAAETHNGQLMMAKEDVLRGHFTEERQLKDFNAPLNSEGHFVVAPAHGLIWDIEKPFATTTVITPAGLIQTVNGAKITQLSAQKMPFLLHLYEMLGGALAGNWQPLEKEFEVVREGNREDWQVSLKPRKNDDPGMPFRSIVVSGHQFVEKVMMTRIDGDTDTLLFDQQLLSHLPPSEKELMTFHAVHP